MINNTQNMSLIPISLLWLLSIPLFLSNSQSPTGNKFLIDCGGGGGHTSENGLRYVSDEGFVSVGEAAALPDGAAVALPVLATLRHFPDSAARKYCYAVPAEEGRRYLVRTTYFYGGFDGGDSPPAFEQAVDGTPWGEVDTAEDYAAGLGSYYEAVVGAGGRQLSVCLARSERTPAARSPFISALEVELLDDSLYNTTDFGNFALRTVARTNFGARGNEYVGFPDDKFNRLWQPFKDQNPVVTSHAAVEPTEFWNLPPAKAFATGITTSRGKTLRVRWPAGPPLPQGEYHVALYFQDNRTPSPYSWRVFDVSLGGQLFYSALNVTTDGAAIYSPRWPLSAYTEIVLTPAPGMPVGPVICAAELLQVIPLGGRTLFQDEEAMIDLARSFNNPPPDWSGDPCLPEKNSWTGVTCSKSGNFARVTSLDLTDKGLSGTLPSSIANLTALNHIWFGGNKLTGHIPEMGLLKELKTLHLENNQLEGTVPDSLGQIPGLYEILLQNNKLDGQIPSSLQNRNDISIEL